MKTEQILTAEAIAAETVNYDSIKVDFPGLSIQLNVTEVAASLGTAKLQGSCDNRKNWADIAGTEKPYSGSKSLLWNLDGIYVPHVRLSVIEAGSSVLNAFYATKSDQ
jgi:hypothetical protein